MTDVERALPRLSDLVGGRPPFVDRHVGPGGADSAAMLAELGLASLSALLDAALPPAIRLARPLALPPPVSEGEVVAELRALAGENATWTSLIGMGYAGTITPAVLRRNVLENPAWYSAYTPYQAEISQGRLEALLTFQTMVGDLTGLEVANASLLDEASAAAEAMEMCRAAARAGEGGVCFVDAACHPPTIEVVRTRAAARRVTVVVGDPEVDLGEGPAPFGVLLQHPGTAGEVRDLAPVVAAAHARGALVAVAADLLACTLVVPPGELGADLAVGSTQRFGVPLFYGGPHAAYLAARPDLLRLVPGRLVGRSRDAEGRPALRLALQTREQHIRRERATSNICTAQALLAVMAGSYAVYHGPDGLRAIAARVHRLTVLLAEGLRRAGWTVAPAAYFDTVAVDAGERAEAVVAAAAARRINLRRHPDGRLGISLDETSTEELVGQLLDCFDAAGVDLAQLDQVAESPLGRHLRTSPYLEAPVFHAYRSETAMVRYLRRLADRDLALDRAMIPLGSCTMKLNGAAELSALSLPGFADLHPFAPPDQAAGYRRMIGELEGWLAEITGYDTVSVQPNAGSQGELAGLLAIRAYLAARGEGGRDLCLLPTSAHGTNAASAAMAGLRVVPVACDADGNVDLDDLDSKLAANPGAVATAMLTYPSTSGVYEEAIVEICSRVHAAGGQVYLDGANLNALAGWSRLGELGGDVSHVNLHKTFCIPHGGGGPGVGPIGVKAHLSPFLPGSAGFAGLLEGRRGGAVAGAPFGSPGVLSISWAYLRLMGAEGLAAATAGAVLAANYVARRLAPHYRVRYTGRNGLVAHECVLDLAELTARTGVTNEDVAKRLVDYGFHAPTMSFPIAGCLMVEPTESEPKAELDRFCRAMIAIRHEIDEIASGSVALEQSALRRAPHTAAAVTDDRWDRPYDRRRAAFPLGDGVDKYWPPVARVDNVAGDRHPVLRWLPGGPDAESG